MKMISTISYVAAAVVGYIEVVPDGCVVINWSSFVPNPIARFLTTPFMVSKAVSVHSADHQLEGPRHLIPMLFSNSIRDTQTILSIAQVRPCCPIVL